MKNIIRFTLSALITLILLTATITFEFDCAQAGTIKPEGFALSYEAQVQYDQRAEKLTALLRQYNSPLISEVDTFIEEADKNGLDWKFLPAIAGVESNFGRVLLDGSYNPFGWGGGYLYFKSFEQGIKTVAQGLTEPVYRGGKTPEAIGPIYCPPNYRYWINGVWQFMNELENIRTETALQPSYTS